MIEAGQELPSAFERVDLVVVENNTRQVGAQQVAQFQSGLDGGDRKSVDGTKGGQQVQFAVVD